MLVVGAGISGLTAAYRFQEAGQRVLVAERRETVGGAIRTLRRDGWSFELGPNTILDGEPTIRALVRDLGLEDQRLTASPAARYRYLWHRGRLAALPDSPLSLLRSPLFSAAAKLRLLREPWAPPPPPEEESVGDFVRRRLGGEILERAVAPFLSGIHAGDPERLSLRWALPKLAELEDRHGSLLRGLRAARRARRSQAPAKGREATGRGALMSFRDGQETLPHRLAEVLGDRLHTATTCLSVNQKGDRFRCELRRGNDESHTVRCRQLVLTTPADIAADLLEATTGGRAAALRELPYAPLAVISLGYPREAIAHPLDGFGFLAPRNTGLKLLGGLFASTLFPHRAPEGQVALSVFLGGSTDPEVLAGEDDELIALAEADLTRALGASAPASFRHLQRWPRALPQLEIGHARFERLATDLESELPGLHLLGNYRTGAAVPDCVRRATELVRRQPAAGL
ncbi:MAG: protoporphyrinogen oxidase [Acidobacteriota bacterium]